MEKRVFSSNCSGTTGHPHARKIKKISLDTDFTYYTKINSKLITDLNVNQKMVKLLIDNIGPWVW